MTAAPTTVHLGTFSPLRHQAYRRVWLANVVSGLGTFLQLVAAPWVMLELTGSPFMVGLVAAALAFPRLLMTVPAGALADAIDRRTLLVTGQLANATTVTALGVMVVTGRITPWSLVGLSLLVGTGTALSLPAFQSVVQDLVPRDEVPQAIALNSAGFNVARAIGPAIGGAMVAAGLAGQAFLLNGASFLVVVAVVFTLPRDVAIPGPREAVWRAVRAGIRYVGFTPPLRRLLLVTAAFALLATSVQTLLPNVTSDDLGLGASAYGILLGTFGGGALVGALSQRRLRNAVPGRLSLPAAITAFGVTATGFGLSRTAVLSGAMLALAGFSWVWTATTMNASAQLLAPRWVRGRVISLYQLAFLGMQPLGSLAAGAIAEQTGAASAVAILSVGSILLGISSFRIALPVLGEITEPTLPSDWTTPPHAQRVSGSPVLVITTFTITPEAAPGFFDAAAELRRQRYRTGADRWQLYRNADNPERVTEIFQVHDWNDHMRQHGRIDAEVAAAIRAARTFDTSDDGPVTRHLVGIDLLDAGGPPAFEDLVAVHDDLHSHDGSLPLDHDAEERT